jgi:hypothetical protein
MEIEKQWFFRDEIKRIYGSQAAFCRVTGHNESFISEIINGSRILTDRAQNEMAAFFKDEKGRTLTKEELFV